MTLARPLASTALLAAGSLVWACASFTGEGSPETAADGGPLGAADGGYVPSCADLVPSPSAVAFGEARVVRDGGGSSVSFEVLVRNAGTVPRALSARAAAPFRVEEAGPMGLAPGEARPVHVSFAPAAVGPVTGALELTTADGCASTVPLEGSGTDSDYAVTPAALSIDVLCGKTGQAAVEVDTSPTVTGSFAARIAPPFSVPASGALVSGGKVKVTVSLATPFPLAGARQDAELSLSLPNEAAPRKIPVAARSRGADIQLGWVGTDFVARNVGNDVAHVVFKPSDGTISIMPAKAELPPLGTVILRFAGPSIAWNFRAEQDPSFPGAVCHSDVFAFEATGGGGTEVSGGN